MHDQPESAVIAGAKLSPPAIVWGAEFLGIGVATWIHWFTLFYLALMISHKMWVMGKEAYFFWFAKKPVTVSEE